LIFILSAPVLVLVVVYVYLLITGNNTALAYLKQVKSSEDLLFLESIKSIKLELPTFKNIHNKYEKLFNKEISEKELLRKLKEAVDSKIINVKVVNVNDEPYMIWNIISERDLFWRKMM